MTIRLDHLVVTSARLEEGAAFAEALLGVPLDPGGHHDRFATHNRLLSLGPGLYLEVIAPDPGAPPPGRPRWFGLDGVARDGAPRLAAWVARGDLAAAPPEAGEALALARGDLAWTVLVPPDGAPPWGGAFPALIRWHGAHPTERLPDRGVRLLALEVGHPRAPRLRALLPDLDPLVRIVEADAPSLRARLRTPGGEVSLPPLGRARPAV